MLQLPDVLVICRLCWRLLGAVELAPSSQLPCDVLVKLFIRASSVAPGYWGYWAGASSSRRDQTWTWKSDSELEIWLSPAAGGPPLGMAFTVSLSGNPGPGPGWGLRVRPRARLGPHLAGGTFQIALRCQSILSRLTVTVTAHSHLEGCSIWYHIWYHNYAITYDIMSWVGYDIIDLWFYRSMISLLWLSMIS